MTTIFTNGRIYAPVVYGQDRFVSAMIITGKNIAHVGYDEDPEIVQAKNNGGKWVDLRQKIVVPGFIDAHVHLLNFGLSLRKLDLKSIRNRDDIRHAIREFAREHPEVPRILCRGWVPDGSTKHALAKWLDDLDEKNRSIFIEALDFHSSWLNSSAIEELQLHKLKEEPQGGKIHRDDNNKPSGLFSEEASLLITSPHTNRVTPHNERMRALDEAVKTYTEAGVTGVIDMAMDEDTWEILIEYRQKHGFPFHIAAHWLVEYSKDPEKYFGFVQRAINLRNEGYNPIDSPDFCIAGVKILSDGVIDSCTAALSKPYLNQDSLHPTIWPAETLQHIIHYADSNGLQVAIHAIGDQAVHQAVEAIRKHGSPGRRHRIEHLELTRPEDAAELGKLDITASVQPVHSDPVLSVEWASKIIGEERYKRVFAYKDFLDGGARMAFGTDVPTAPHPPLPNIYSATTRRSTFDPSSPLVNNPQFALPLAEAFTAATSGGAESRHAEVWTGSLKPGLRADFVLLDVQWNAEKLLEGKVLETWSRGERVFSSDVRHKM